MLKAYIGAIRLLCALFALNSACGSTGGTWGGGGGGGGGTVDTTPPTIAVSAPRNGDTVAISFTIGATASDNVGVVGVQFYLDGVALGTEDTSAPFTALVANTSEGSHTVRAHARDAAGNAVDSEQITITVSNAIPVVQTVDPSATVETKALFSNLQAITLAGGSGILFGMMSGLDRGFFQVTPQGTIDWSFDGVKSDIRMITGTKGPAVVAFDAASIVGDWWDPSYSGFEDLKNNAKNDFRNLMRAQFSRGGFSSMHWHMANPMSGTWDSYRSEPHEIWRVAPPEVCTQMIEKGLSVPDCGSHFGDLQDKFSELADWLKTVTVSASDLRLIPIIFRAFHEHSGGWFWWGWDATAEKPVPDERYTTAFRGLWAWMVDYMQNVKSVHNLLWAVAPNGRGGWDPPLTRDQYLAFCPDMSLVDVLGFDFYTNDLAKDGDGTSQLAMIAGLGRENGKVAAMTEGGYGNVTIGYSDYTVTDNQGARTVSVLSDPPARRRDLSFLVG